MLVNALKHSGLGITSASTADYIYKMLSQAFPYSLYIIQSGAVKKSFVWSVSKSVSNAVITASGATINTYYDSETYVTYTATSSKILFDEYAKQIVVSISDIVYTNQRPGITHSITMYVNGASKGTQSIVKGGTYTWPINDVVKSVYFIVNIYHGYYAVKVTIGNIYLQN